MELLESDVSVLGFVEVIGITFESVQVKVLRLWLEVVGTENCVATTTTTTSLPDADSDVEEAALQSPLPGVVSPK